MTENSLATGQMSRNIAMRVRYSENPCKVPLVSAQAMGGGMRGVRPRINNWSASPNWKGKKKLSTETFTVIYHTHHLSRP
jgi:hypothetical protein